MKNENEKMKTNLKSYENKKKRGVKNKKRPNSFIIHHL